MQLNPDRGVLFTRAVKSLAVAALHDSHGVGGAMQAAAYAAGRGSGWADVAQYHKAAVGAAGTAVDGDNLRGRVGSDMIALYRPLSVIGRLRGLRRVPANVRMLSPSAGTSGGFVGEGDGIPLAKMTLASGGVLDMLKSGSIAAVTKELLLSGDPAAESNISADLSAALAYAEDSVFCGGAAAVAQKSPAGLAYGVTGRISSGTTVSAWIADLRLLCGDLVAAGGDLSRAAWIMSTATALYLRTLRDDGGYVFPGVATFGTGELWGLPAVATSALDLLGSPAERYLLLVDQRKVWLAEDPAVDVTASTAALIEMSDAPGIDSVAGTAANMTSAFQTESVAIKAVHGINWRALSGSVALLRAFSI